MHVLLQSPDHISEMVDAAITTPTEGQMLRRNAQSKWENSTPGTLILENAEDFYDASEIDTLLNNYVTTTALTTALGDYALASALADYALNSSLGTAAAADIGDFDAAGAAAAVQALLSDYWAKADSTQTIPTSGGNGSLTISESGSPRFTISVSAGASSITASGGLSIVGASVGIAGALTVSNGIGVSNGASFDGDVLIAPNTGSKFGAFGAVAAFQPASANQAAVAGSVSDGDFAALTISADYDQAEVQSLRDKCESLADDVRALTVLGNQVRADLVTLGWIKGSV